MSIVNIGKNISSTLLLPNVGKNRISTILQTYSNNDWRRYIDPNIGLNVYSKTKVYEDNMINMYVATWKPGYISTIHSHNPVGCWYRILQGELVERQYDPDTLFLSRFSVLNNPDTMYINDSIAFHSVENRDDINSAASIHVYPKTINV